jgi:hypothetical protein
MKKGKRKKSALSTRQLMTIWEYGQLPFDGDLCWPLRVASVRQLVQR